VLGDLPGGIPEVLVDQVPVEVHRHRRRGMSEQPLDGLGIGAGAQPRRRRRVRQVVYAQLGTGRSCVSAKGACAEFGTKRSIDAEPGPI
jgi:hypothetical protein